MKKLNLTKTNIFLISLSTTLAILLGFSIYVNLSIERPIRIEDFSSMTQDQLLAWSQENEIKIETIEEYNDEIEVGKVISQDTIVGERLFAGSTVKVIISKGPNPEVMVNLIDFKGKDIGEVQQFIELNRLLAASIEFEKSTDVNSAYFIRTDVQATSIKRGQAIKFYISTGSKEELTTVVVPDFTEYTRQQISSWGQSNNIKTNITEEFNNDVSPGKVISQSQAPNTSIYDGSSVTIKMSLGAGVVLENLVGKSKSTIDKFINDNGLKVNYSYTYSSAQNKDLGISMSPSASTKVGNGTTVNVTLSLGKISISDFKGKTLASLQAWVAEVNKQGADLKVTSTQEYSEGTSSGLIITQTPSSGDVNPGVTIKASVSKGVGTVVGTFVGTTKTSQEGLKVNTSTSYHASIPSGQVISQSISAGTTVDTNSSINLVVSLGKVQVGSYSSLSALESWKNSVNANGANISISTTEDWNSAEKGTLVSHTNANSSVNPGTTITALVSRGPSVTVPNYVGGGEPSSGGGITINVISRDYSNSIPNGKVISQNVSPGIYASGIIVGIRVSKGPEPIVTAQVPSAAFSASDVIRGNPEDETPEQYLSKVRSAIIGGMSPFTSISFSYSNIACILGEVTNQTPSPGQFHPITTTINVTLCKP